MRTDYILSIDPGVSTGIALLSCDDTSIPRLVQGWQFGGGLQEFLSWWEDRWTWELELPVVIAEKFQPINHSNYALTTASVEPLRIEGAMVALGMMPDYTAEEKRWRRPVDQYLFGGKTKAEKKKRMHSALKDLDFYRTGKDLGAPDADDFRSATAHALSYLARVVKHKPTFELLSYYSMREDTDVERRVRRTAGED